MASVSRISGSSPAWRTRVNRRNAFAALLALSGFARAQTPSSSGAFGHWRGDARLFHAKTRARTGPIPVDLHLAADGTLSGTVGDALMPRTAPKSRTDSRAEYQLVVSGSIHPVLDPAARHMVVIVTLEGVSGLDADFHIKRRFGFDPGMLAGHFDVSRVD